MHKLIAKKTSKKGLKAKLDAKGAKKAARTAKKGARKSAKKAADKVEPKRLLAVGGGLGAIALLAKKLKGGGKTAEPSWQPPVAAPTPTTPAAGAPSQPDGTAAAQAAGVNEGTPPQAATTAAETGDVGRS